MAYTAQQLKIAKQIAAQGVRSAFPAGGAPRIGQWLAQETQRVAKTIFGGTKGRQISAPAPAPAPPPPAPTPDPRIAELTKESEAYRAQAEEQIAAGQARVAELENEELQRQRAAELQNRLAIQSAASKARGQMGAQLKIAAASPTSKTAGTAAFKRRDQVRLAPILSTAGINVPTGSVLNI